MWYSSTAYAWINIVEKINQLFPLSPHISELTEDKQK